MHDQAIIEDKPSEDYVKPTVKPVGPVRDITLGGSPGTGDSGGFGVEDPFGGT